MVKNLLLPIGLKTDLSPLEILDELFKDKSKIEITLMTVVTIPAVTSLEQEEINDIEAVKESHNKLDEAAKIIESMGYRVKKKIIYSRDIVDAIVEESIQNPYDMIILIKRRKTPKFIGRSISKSVLPKIHKPILILTMD